MVTSRRVAVAAFVVWTGAMAFAPLVHRPAPTGGPRAASNGKLTVVYVGADDCAPCLAWRRKRRPEFEKSVVFPRIDYREVIAGTLKETFDDAYWPEALRGLRDEVRRGGGGVPFWMILRDGRVLAAAGGGAAWDAKIWPLILREA